MDLKKLGNIAQYFANMLNKYPKLSITFPPEHKNLKDRFLRLSKEKGIKQTDLARMAIANYLNQVEMGAIKF